MLTAHWFCSCIVRRPWLSLSAISVVMLGCCVAGPLLHKPEIDTGVEAFRTHGTTIANTENTRYLFHEQRDQALLVSKPPTVPAGTASASSAGRRRLHASAASVARDAMASISATASGNERRRVQIAEVRVCNNCWYNVDSVYGAGTEQIDGGNILTAKTFRAICEWEDRLADQIDYDTHCVRTGGECCPAQSLPRLLTAALGVPCDSLTDDLLGDLLKLYTQESVIDGIDPRALQDQFLDDTFSFSDPNNSPSAWLTRSLLCLDRNTYGETNDYRIQRKAMGEQLASLWREENGLAQQVEAGLPGADSVSLHVFNRYMFERLFEDQLLTDLNLAGAAMVVLLLAMVVHTGSFCLAACGMLHILLSVPAAYSLYTVIGFTYFPYINLIGIFVVAGVGVDDVYVFHDAFTQSLVLLPPGTSLEIRLSWAFRRAGTAMLITSVTTSASFLANLVSPVPPIRVFGVFNGILIFANFFFVITWFPTVVVLHHRYAMGKQCCCCCPKGTEQARTTYRDPSLPDVPDVELEDLTNPAISNPTLKQTHPSEWRTVEKVCRTRYTALLYRLRWIVVALLVAITVVATILVATRLQRATKVIQMMRNDHPITVYTELLARFPSSPHVPQDGMEVLVLMGLIASDTGDTYDASDRGELVFDEQFDIAQARIQQWIVDIIDKIVTTPELRVDSPKLHPLETFGDWVALQKVASEEASEICETDRDAAIDAGFECTLEGAAILSPCGDALLRLPFPTLPPPDTHHPYIYQTLRSREIEATVHDDSWWGMTPALRVPNFGSTLDRPVAWPGGDNANKAWIESLGEITTAGTGALQINDRFLMRWRGQINIGAGEAGQYEFSLTSDDGSMLYVDHKRLLDNDGQHGRRTVQTATQLSSGAHDIVVTFFEWDGGEILECMWRKVCDQDIEFQAISGAGFVFDVYTLGNRSTAISSIFPLPADVVTMCVSDPEFLNSNYNRFLWSHDAVGAPTNRVVAAWYVPTKVVGGWNYYTMSDYVKHWQALFDVDDRSFATQYWFGVMDLQANLATSALIAMAISLLLACSVLLAATRSISATILATTSIFGVLSCTLATLVLQGWELGILESMCLAILVGISCDFVVHLAHAYMTSVPTDNLVEVVRLERTRWALSTMGISVLSAGATTLIAAFALSNGQVEFFHAFGTFLMTTIGFALLFALVGFSAAAMLIGPTTRKPRCSAPSERKSEPDSKSGDMADEADVARDERLAKLRGQED